MLVAWLFLTSCEKTQEEVFVDTTLGGAFALQSMEFLDTSYAEVDIDGKTHVVDVKYLPHGIKSDSFITSDGWKEVTRIEFFSDKGVKTNYVKPIDSLNTLNGLVIMGVPFKFKGDRISCQIFNINY